METTIADATAEQHLEWLRERGYVVKIEAYPEEAKDEAPDRTVESMRVRVASSWLFQGKDLGGWKNRVCTEEAYLDELDAALQRAYPAACVEEISFDECVAEIGVGVSAWLFGDKRWRTAPAHVRDRVRRIATRVARTAPIWGEAEEDDEDDE